MKTTSGESINGSGLLLNIRTKGLCTGCGLCEGMAAPGSVTMQMSTRGYLRPVVNQALSAETERAIAAVCPGVELRHERGLVDYHRLWGPLRSVHGAHAADPAVRQQGSSGGVISALALHLIESGKVDFVAQIAVSPSDPLLNELQLSRSREDVLRAAGSRYAPSAPLRAIPALLAQGGRFAFVGKPCDVAALRAYLRESPHFAERVPYLLSFMCAGVPSQKGTHELLRAMKVEREEVVSFRYRGDGWPGKARAVLRDGRSSEMDYNSSWGNILNRHLQFRCKICADGTGEFADLVCADAWYGKDGYPDFAERAGRSLVLARTAAGAELLGDALAVKALSAEALGVDEIKAMQPYQKDRKELLLGRLLAAHLKLGQVTRYRGFRLLVNSLHHSPVKWLRSAVGAFRRAKGEAQ